VVDVLYTPEREEWMGARSAPFSVIGYQL
jgi:hypothetical protein